MEGSASMQIGGLENEAFEMEPSNSSNGPSEVSGPRAENSETSIQLSCSTELAGDSVELENIQLEPAHLHSQFSINWYQLSYAIQSGRFSLTGQRRPILHKLSGQFRSSELSAVLGPSGAGKSSLIDCLLGKKDSRLVSGRTSVQFGVGVKPRRLKIATIPQEDHLLDTLTVSETFMFASRIKNAHLDWTDQEEDEEAEEEEEEEVDDKKKNIDIKIKEEQKKKKIKVRKAFDHKANVQRVLEQLQLVGCANNRCAKLSGGQYKRVSIGQELLSRPDLLVLDEPTSGLDAVTCLQTINALRALIERSAYPMAIVVIIHQPDMEVFSLFHHVYALAVGGEAIYEGSPSGIFPAVERAHQLVTAQRNQNSRGHKETDEQIQRLADRLTSEQRQPGSNPARILVELAAQQYGHQVTHAMTQLLQQHQPEQSPLSLQIAHADSKNPFGSKFVPFDYEANRPSERRAQLDRRLSQRASPTRTISVWLAHLSLHTKRSWLSVVRDPMLCSVQVLLHLLVPLLISYAFSGIEQSDACPRVRPLDVVEESWLSGDEPGILEELAQELRAVTHNMGYLFFQLYVIIFAAVCATSLTYPLAMHVLLKEFRNGWYSLSSYFLGRTLADLPLPTINVIIAMAISYHLTGQPVGEHSWRFLSVAALTVLASLVAQTTGLAFGALLMDAPQSAVFVAPASTAPLVVVCGFLVRISSLPFLLRILSYYSYFTHLWNGILISRYGFNRCPCESNDFSIDQEHQVPPQARTIISLWLETFQQPQRQQTNLTIDQQAPDLVERLVNTIGKAQTFGHQIQNCQQVKPYVLLDYQLEDKQLLYCFLALFAMLLALRALAYFVLCWKIRRSL